jgi:putative ABC transport system permease protein
MLSALRQDLHYAFRMFGKQPGFVAVAAIAIALGIGANTVIFSAVDALILRPFSFPNQERLVSLWERNLETGIRRGSVSPGNLVEWEAQGKSFEQFVAMRSLAFDLTGNDQPERYTGYGVSVGFFETLGVKPMLGRTFQREDGELGRDQVIVLKHTLWEKRFGSNPQIIGQTVTLNGKNHTVIGVMPPEFNFPYGGGEMWAPLVFTQEDRQNRGSHYLQVMALLKPGVSIEQADAEIRSIADRLQVEYADTNSGRSAYAIALNADVTRGSRMYMPILIGAVGFVLLIACANVANLLLVRASAREREIAVRMAIGASRWRVIRQMLTESVVLALAGGLLGLGLSFGGIRAMANGMPQGMTRYIAGWEHLGMNFTLFGFALIVSIVTGIIFGFVPAWQATKTNFNEALKEGSKGAARSARHRMRSALVVGEVALSLVLLIGAGLMIRSFVQILRTDFGIKPDNVMTMRLALSRDKNPEEKQRINFYQQVQSRIAALPSVTSVGAVNLLPMSGSNNSSNFQIVGQPPFPKATQPYTQVRVVTPGYFVSIGTALYSGRLFTERDNAQAPRVALVNEAFARRFLGGRESTKERITIGGENSPPLEIIGTVANVMNDDLDDPAEPGIYLPHAQNPWFSMWLVIRANSEPTMLVSATRQEILALDPNQAISDIKTMQAVIDERSSPKKVMSWMMGIFAVIALILAAVGLYAVMSYIVAQRTHEIGIRLALGAGAGDVFKLVVGQGLILTLVGLTLGLAGAFALTRAMAQILYGVSATDPITFLGISLLLGAVALLACYIPARRATRVDPMVALRNE